MVWINDCINKIICGNALTVLKQMPDESVQCAITSPPYWGLRDYGLEPLVWSDGWLGNLGLEPSPELYVEHLVEVYREIKRVLRKDGTFWIVMGDSYASGKGTCFNPGGGSKSLGKNRKEMGAHPLDRGNISTLRESGLKPKDLCGMPWRVAFALQSDGWWLRRDIVWSKPNPMPESAKDRPTTSHEYVFILTKSRFYYYDQEAIRESCSSGPSDIRKMIQSKERIGGKHKILVDPFSKASAATNIGQKRSVGNPISRNRRSVWTIATQPYPEAHFATFPDDLVRPMILAGTSEKGCCSKCGAPWERVIEKGEKIICDGRKSPRLKSREIRSGSYETIDGIRQTASDMIISKKTIGWRPTCDCYDEFYRIEFPKARSARKRHQRDAWDGRWRRVRRRPGKDHWPIVPCVVVDPCIGSGTTAVVAMKLARNFIGIDLSPKYCAMSEKRLNPLREQRRLI